MKNEKTFPVKYIGFGKETTVDLNFSPELFSSGSYEFNPGLARLSALLTMIGYNLPYGQKDKTKCNIHRALSEIGMSAIEISDKTGADDVDSVYASLDMTVNSEPVKLIFVCLIGSHHGQWYNNFDAGTGIIHKGFSGCAEIKYNKLEEYLSEYCNDEKRKIFLVCGHSRGAATAGILAHKLKTDEKLALSSDVYAYTFAAPSYVKASEKSSADDGIFNILNEEDFVVRCMPGNWGFERFGKAVILPNKLNTPDFDSVLSRVNRYFSAYSSGGEFYPFKKGPAPLDKLLAEICENVTDINQYYEKKFRCPVGLKSLEDYFTLTLCTITAEGENPHKFKEGINLLIKTFFLRSQSDSIFKSIADFFMIYEGIAAVTKGKISKTYFSSTHDMAVYSAFVMATTENSQEDRS